MLAGDISPIDVITHVPVLCEDNDIPYVYVPAKEVRTVRYISAVALCMIPVRQWNLEISQQLSLIHI